MPSFLVKAVLKGMFVQVYGVDEELSERSVYYTD